MLFFGIIVLIGILVNMYIDLNDKQTLDLGLLVVFIYVALTVAQRI